EQEQPEHEHGEPRDGAAADPRWRAHAGKPTARRGAGRAQERPGFGAAASIVPLARGRSSMAEPQPSKLVMRVRFPPPASSLSSSPSPKRQEARDAPPCRCCEGGIVLDDDEAEMVVVARLPDHRDLVDARLGDGEGLADRDPPVEAPA